MARRYINTSKFNPYTFEEMYNPALTATQLHMQQAQNMAQLQTMAAGLGSYIDPQVDPEAYAAWDSYMKAAKGMSDNLIENGLSTKSFNDTINLTSQYAQKIKPIENAVETKQKYYTLFAETKSKNPDMAFVRTPNDIPLSEYMRGMPAIEGVSGNAIQNQVSLLASHIYGGNTSAISRDAYDKYYDIVTTQLGYTPDQLAAQLADPNSGINFIMKTVMDMNNVSSLSEADQQRMAEYAYMGAINGAVGSTKKEMKESNYFKQDASNRAWAALNHRISYDNARLKLSAAQTLLKAGNSGSGSSGKANTPPQVANAMMGGVGIFDNSVYATHLSSRDAESAKMYDALKSYFDKVGLGKITELKVSKDGKVKKGDKVNLRTGSSKAADSNYISSTDFILDPTFSPEGFVLKINKSNTNKFSGNIGKDLANNYTYYLIPPELVGIGSDEFSSMLAEANKFRNKGNVEAYKQIMDVVYATAIQNIQENSNSFSKTFSGKGNTVLDLLDSQYDLEDFDDSYFDAYN